MPAACKEVKVRTVHRREQMQKNTVFFKETVRKFVGSFRGADCDTDHYLVGDGQGMWRVWGRLEVCTGCWWGSLREGCHWGDQDVDGRIILRWIFRKLEGVVGTGWSWLRIGTGGGHLWVR